MNPAFLLSALLPLIAFWIVEAFYGLKAALIFGSLIAVIEIAYEKIRYRKVSRITLFSNLTVLLFGGISWILDSGIAFKLQPAVIEVAFAIFLFWYMRKKGASFFAAMMGEMIEKMNRKPGRKSDNEKFAQNMRAPGFSERMFWFDRRIQIFFCIHGLALAAIAIWGSTGLWILFKGVLFYALWFAWLGISALMVSRRARG